MRHLESFDLTGKVAVVTGGNGGIGRAIALGLADAGASVGILARNEAKSAGVVEELHRRDVAAFATTVDLNERSALKPAVESIERELGPIDVLVNNAGITAVASILEMSMESWDRVLETNLTAVFLLSQAVGRSMAARRKGKIINIASEYAIFGAPGVPSYAAAKGGLVQLTKTMAIQLAAYNIQVNAIVPGWTETDLTAHVKAMPMYDEIIKRIPAGRFAKPEECAGAAIFLAAPASDFVTGSLVYVDGGYAAR